MQHSAKPLLLARWLLLCALMVIVMVVVGGITRITESGLSITEWKPVTGIIPPLTDADWQQAFAEYKNSSQYVLMNVGMDLAAFKTIYFWEYFHRLLGRVLGALYVLPLLWFWIKRAIPEGFGPRLLLLLVLGGMQGAVGWLMVKSGLTDRVNVEPAMLAAHLLMALLLFSLLVWTMLDFRALAMGSDAPRARLKPFPALVLAALFFQLFLGAITAGLRAGQVSNTWPLMNDRLFPEGVEGRGSAWLTLTADPFLAHFLHRWWAWVAVALLILLARQAKAAGNRSASIAIHSAFGIQILLGIAVVLLNVNPVLAVLHQLTGVLVLGAAIWGAHVCGRAKQAR